MWALRSSTLENHKPKMKELKTCPAITYSTVTRPTGSLALDTSFDLQTQNWIWILKQNFIHTQMGKPRALTSHMNIVSLLLSRASISLKENSYWSFCTSNGQSQNWHSGQKNNQQADCTWPDNKFEGQKRVFYSKSFDWNINHLTASLRAWKYWTWKERYIIRESTVCLNCTRSLLNWDMFHQRIVPFH